MSDPDGFRKLVEILARLRGPDGCPWDREQSFATLRGYLVEECYEAVDALDRDDAAGLCEELGDLLMQIVFLARLAEEQARFTVDDVVDGIVEKMIRRHPHVFGSARADTSEEVLRHWEAIKRREKGESAGASSPPRSILDGLPAALPALLKAQRLGAKAARVGFDWARPIDVLDKVEEEIAELRRAMPDGGQGVIEELGDVLFSLAMLARRLDVDPEAALESANRKFYRRFTWLEAELEREGSSVERSGSERLEQLWERAKRHADA